MMAPQIERLLKPHIELLVGMIASGKSTYARKRADEGALVVSHDDLTQMLHARYRYEQGLRDVYRRMEEALALHAIKAGRDVVIDRTHLTLESRKRWIELARRESPFTVPILAVVFPIESPLDHAGRRFETDPRGRSDEDWLRVAEHHYKQAQAEPISQWEGFDAILNITQSEVTAR